MLVLAAAPIAAEADGRVALVIGNAEYGAEIGRLKNPANDAELIAATLTDLGFAVDLVLNADQKAMKRAVKGFGARLREAGPNGIGLFYYAGHGLQVGGENFLIPVGAQIEAEGDVELEAVSAGSILSQMQYAGNAINLVFLDACRNNPLTRGFRSAERGLARVDAPRGSFVGYSTAPGEVAEDGAGANSPYAIALAKELQKPGESVDVAHRNVRSQVLAATGKRQTPWDSSSLTGEVVLAALTPEASASSAAAPAPGAGTDKESLFWESIKDSNNATLYQAYLKQYPGGTFSAIAEARIADLGAAPKTDAQTASLTPEAAPEAPAEIEDRAATYVARQSANVRAAPSTDAKVLGKLAEDDAVAVTGRVKGKDWLRIDFKGQAGYVSAKLLAEVDAKEVAAWNQVKVAPGKEALEAFLKDYPSGTFNAKAKDLLASLQVPPTSTEATGSDQQASATAAAPAPELAGGEITAAMMAQLPAELRPDPSIIDAYNAARGLHAPAPKRGYRLEYSSVFHDAEYGDSFDEESVEVANVGGFRVERTNHSFDGGSLNSKGTRTVVGTTLLDFKKDDVGVQWSSDGKFSDNDSSRLKAITSIQGLLFPIKVGNTLSYTSTEENYDEFPGGTNSRRDFTFTFVWMVIAEMPCASVTPRVPGKCFKVSMSNGSYTFYSYYSAEMGDFIPEQVYAQRGQNGADQMTYTLKSFSLQ
jgi:uncharacterized caspase-like protein